MAMMVAVQISDINECELGYNECTQRCINLGGSYKCACEHDYQLGTDGKSCYRTSYMTYVITFVTSRRGFRLTSVCLFVCLSVCLLR